MSHYLDTVDIDGRSQMTSKQDDDQTKMNLNHLGCRQNCLKVFSNHALIFKCIAFIVMKRHWCSNLLKGYYNVFSLTSDIPDFLAAKTQLNTCTCLSVCLSVSLKTDNLRFTSPYTFKHSCTAPHSSFIPLNCHLLPLYTPFCFYTLLQLLHAFIRFVSWAASKTSS